MTALCERKVTSLTQSEMEIVLTLIKLQDGALYALIAKFISHNETIFKLKITFALQIRQSSIIYLYFSTVIRAQRIGSTFHDRNGETGLWLLPFNLLLSILLT